MEDACDFGPFSRTELIALDALELQRIADDLAVNLPDADLEHRVDPNWDLYKVRGKVFMLMTDLPGRRVVILKADPDQAVALREQYADITPGYHMNKSTGSRWKAEAPSTRRC